MATYHEIISVVKLIFAFILGAFIGYERECHGKEAGIRTYAAVCVGAALFTFIGEQLGEIAATSRIVANIVTGVGFLGAGIIYRSSNSKGPQGLTTAATLWGTSAIGVSVGLDMFILAIVSSIMLYFVLAMHHMKWYVKWKKII